MTCHVFSGGVICDGRGKTVRKGMPCPWCWLKGDRLRPSLVTEIYSGYCAPDVICGRCGYKWNADYEGAWRDQDNRQRERNIAAVRSFK